MITAARAVLLLSGSPCEEAHALDAGSAAPCGGVLLPLPEATHALRCMRVELPGCRQDVETCEGGATLERKAHESVVQALNERISQADQALAAMARCPECERVWWDSPALWAGAGVTVGVSITLAILKATAASK